jgi:hypothetical protein
VNLIWVHKRVEREGEHGVVVKLEQSELKEEEVRWERVTHLVGLKWR